MGFFQRLKNGVARFMYGRNGVDQLGLAAVWGCLILNLVSMLVSSSIHHTVGIVFYWLTLALGGYVVFRIFSKNLYKRREENARWMQKFAGLKSRGAGARARRADKEHKYFTCKGCKAICRVPAGKGKVEITCPKCGKTIKGKT